MARRSVHDVGCVTAVIVVATAFGRPGSDVTVWVYRAAAGLLAALAVLTAMTGARTRVIWFKILSHPPRIVGGVAPRGEFDLSALSAAHNSCRDIQRNQLPGPTRRFAGVAHTMVIRASGP
jgi:hypothetical protein